MKKYILSILIIIVGVMLYSCSDELLNTKPRDKFTGEDVWGDSELSQSFIYSTQKLIMSDLMHAPGIGGGDNNIAYDDVISDNELSTAFGKSLVKDDIDRYFNAGWNVFLKIRNCNLIISKVKESKGIKDSDKPELIAQGKFLRACIYYSKARAFGGYVIIDKVLTAKDYLMMSRSSIKETYDFIINDLQEAAKGLPLASEVPTGRITKGAADALLAEVALQAAAYMDKDKDVYYKISKKASEDLFTLGYSLDSDYAGLFNNYSKAQGSKELIFAKFMSSDNTKVSQTPMVGVIPNVAVKDTKGTPKLKSDIFGWGQTYPTCDLVHDYLVIDADGVAKYWNKTSYYNNWKTNGGYVSNAIYTHRDARFEASIIRDSTKLFDNLVTMRIGGNLYPNNVKKQWSATHTGYFVRKGVDETVSGFNPNAYVNYNIDILRLGRSYLNYAEVMLRLGDTDKAIEYINKTRVGHGKLPALASGLSKAEVWKWYKIERRVELFAENDRYWCLLRWGKEDKLDVIPELNNKDHRIMKISADGKTFTEAPIVRSAADFQFEFTKHRYLFPVPQNEIMQNSKLKQNPGW